MFAASPVDGLPDRQPGLHGRRVLEPLRGGTRFHDDQANGALASLGEIVAVDGPDPVFRSAVLQIDLGVGRSILVTSLLVRPGPRPFGLARRDLILKHLAQAIAAP